MSFSGRQVLPFRLSFQNEPPKATIPFLYRSQSPIHPGFHLPKAFYNTSQIPPFATNRKNLPISEKMGKNVPFFCR